MHAKISNWANSSYSRLHVVQKFSSLGRTINHVNRPVHGGGMEVFLKKTKQNKTKQNKTFTYRVKKKKKKKKTSLT